MSVQTFSQVPDDGITTASENALKGLLSVLRDLVHKVPHTYKSEQEVLDARKKIDLYEEHALGVLKYQASKLPFDRSGHEDVSMNVPAVPLAGQIGPAIDYRELAKAIMAEEASRTAAPLPPGVSVTPGTVVQPTQIVGSTEQGGQSL
jgi:hypothetical protein